MPVDLRQISRRVARRGFDPTQPTAWLAEGPLMYPPADAQDRLFEQVTELSAPGSRVSAEAVAHRDESRPAEMRERFEKFADQLGFDRRIDIG